ncbi:MAG: hypothetical protein KAJ14_12545, partial [Candidatus Omnitrophica bacterium]|nr:hypothetical protein [Candidatus Omnitrophota bacterium]
AIRWYNLGQMTPEMEMVAICQEFGWDYYTYMRQPDRFLRLVKHKLQHDNERAKKEINKSKSNNAQ